MVAASGWQPPLWSPFAGVPAGVNPVLAITFGSASIQGNDVASVAVVATVIFISPPS